MLHLTAADAFPRLRAFAFHFLPGGALFFHALTHPDDDFVQIAVAFQGQDQPVTAVEHLVDGLFPVVHRGGIDAAIALDLRGVYSVLKLA